MNRSRIYSLGLNGRPSAARVLLWALLATVTLAWVPTVVGLHGPDQVIDRLGVALGWFAVLTLLASPAVLAVRAVLWLERFDVARRRNALQRRFDARLCTACGYDLRTLPDRCPECGAPREKWWADRDGQWSRA